MKEIEMKFRVRYAQAHRALRAFGRPTQTLIRDEYFDFPDRRLSRAKRPNGCVRLRCVGDSCELAAKRDHYVRGRYSHSDELEVGVADAKVADKILRRLGFLPLVRLTIRREAWRAGTMTVVLDRIAGLGAFLELEVMAKRSDPARVRAHLAAFLAGLRIWHSPELQMGTMELWLRRKD